MKNSLGTAGLTYVRHHYSSRHIYDCPHSTVVVSYTCVIKISAHWVLRSMETTCQSVTNLTSFFLSFSSTFLFKMFFFMFTISHTVLPYVLPTHPHLFLSTFLRPSLIPVQCVAPPLAWYMGTQVEVWGWMITLWKGWYLRRGDMGEEEDTGTGVTAPHNAPWPGTLMQTQVSHPQQTSRFHLNIDDKLSIFAIMGKLTYTQQHHT